MSHSPYNPPGRPFSHGLGGALWALPAALSAAALAATASIRACFLARDSLASASFFAVCSASPGALAGLKVLPEDETSAPTAPITPKTTPWPMSVRRVCARQRSVRRQASVHLSSKRCEMGCRGARVQQIERRGAPVSRPEHDLVVCVQQSHIPALGSESAPGHCCPSAGS